MECKNCQQTLSQEDSFCRDCGAKLVHKRLTMKYFMTEIRDGFLNIDSSKPMRTFIDLFKRPEVVIEGYITGTRKKYINAFGYFTIAITFSSFFYFVMLKFYPNAMDQVYMQQQSGNEAQTKLMKDMMDMIYEYQTFIFFLMIPMFAFLSWLVFYNRRRHNYAEHLVLNLYTYSHASIVTILIYFLTFWNNDLFTKVALFSMLLQVGYFMYVLKRLYQLTIKQLIIKTLYFLVLLIPIYIAVSLAFVAILIMSGGFDEFMEAEKARRGISYIASSVKNWTS